MLTKIDIYDSFERTVNDLELVHLLLPPLLSHGEYSF